MMRAALMLAAVVGGMVSPASALAEPPAPWISLTRTECFGTCPVFTLRVFADGRVAYKGERFVIRRGLVRSRISAGKLEALRQAVAKAGYATLDEKCCNCPSRTDAPSTYLEIADGAASKAIHHYHGCLSAPVAVSDLEDEIISTAGATRWIGTEAERSRQKWKRGSR